MIHARPLLDPWRDTLITELRLREVPGNRIGEVLAEVDAHCADSGQTPTEAFGDPVTYAQSLIDVHAPGRRPGDAVRKVLLPTAQAFATLAGVFALLNGVNGLVHGSPAEVTAGQVMGVAVGTAIFPLVIAVVFHPALFRRRWAWGIVVAAAPMVPAAPVVLWSTPIAHVSAAALLAAGLFLLAAAWWPTASERVLADRFIDPRTGSEPFATPRMLLAVVRWFLPATLLIAVVLIVLIP
jgi:hypothetical protein